MCQCCTCCKTHIAIPSMISPSEKKFCHIKWCLVCSANILFTLDQISVPKDTIKDMRKRHGYWLSLEYWVLKMQSVLLNSEDWVLWNKVHTWPVLGLGFVYILKWGFPGASDGKESACNAGGTSSIPGSERAPEDGNGYPLQFSC